MILSSVNTVELKVHVYTLPTKTITDSMDMAISIALAIFSVRWSDFSFSISSFEKNLSLVFLFFGFFSDSKAYAPASISTRNNI